VAPPLTVAVGDYDHTRDLFSGEIVTHDVAYKAVARPEELFTRVLEHDEFAAAEMSLAVATSLASRQDGRFVVLPVFPARSFRHGAIWTHVEGPSHPSELAGCRVGIAVWVQTAGVYVRGILSSRYGVDLTSINWIQAGVDTPGRREPAPFEAGAHRIIALTDRTLDELLLAREIDAAITARPPAAAERRDPRVRRMFADVEEEERAYFRDTGVFPIMHVVVVRRSALRDRPDLATELTAALTAAKDRAIQRALSATVPSYPLPWASLHAHAAQDLMGEDFWPYGVSPNELALETFLGYAHEQGITARRLSTKDLFAPEPLRVRT